MDNPAFTEKANYAAPFKAWYTVILFLMLYLCSYMDRAILTILLPFIKKDFALTNLEVSLLVGPAFAITYSILGVGAGWLADRMDRRWLVGIGAVVWGVATALSGFAGSAIQLAVARLSVGIGEATLTPVAHSLIVEKFPPKRLSLALAVFSLGITFGSGLALALGGVLYEAARAIIDFAPALLGGMKPWQIVFVLVALPTLVLVPLICTIADERGDQPVPSAGSAASGGTAIPRQHYRYIVPYFIGFGAVATLNAALSAWTPAYMAATFGMPMGQVGISYGITFVIFTGLGQMIWAGVVDRAYAKGVVDIHARFQMGSLLVSGPAIVIGFLSDSAFVFLLCTGVFLFATYSSQGYANAGLQLVTPKHYRGRMSAIFLASQVLIGYTFGPTGVGFLTDYVFDDQGAIGSAIIVIVALTAPVAMLALGYAAWQRRLILSPG